MLLGAPPHFHMREIYSSKWDGLSRHLIATLWEVEKVAKQDNPDDYTYISKEDGNTVQAVLTDMQISTNTEWRDQFSDAGPETKAPTLTAMLQSGALQPFLSAFLPDGDAQTKMSALMKEFEGRTGITKLNSTQVFVGMQPIKISCTAHFRAWSDALTEVEQPVDQLMEWSLPQFLSREGSIVVRAKEKLAGGSDKSWAETLMPSRSPSLIALNYKGRTFCPLVIESVELPYSSPITSSGKFVQMAVQLQLSSLAAIDKDEWREYRGIQRTTYK